MAYPVETFANVRQRFKPGEAIPIGKKNIFAPVPAGGDVISRAFEFKS